MKLKEWIQSIGKRDGLKNGQGIAVGGGVYEKYYETEPIKKALPPPPPTFKPKREMKEEILNAKRKLYSLLLKLDEETITEHELDIMYALSNDEQIQNFLNSRK